MDLDVTLVVQFTIIVALMLLLNGILFKPILQVIESRHRQIDGTRHEIDNMERLSNADRTAYDARLREGRHKAAAEREALRSAGRDEARRVLTETRAQIAKVVSSNREAVEAAERAAKGSLQNEVEHLARNVVHKLLGREVSA